jgi:hypothetical protein
VASRPRLVSRAREVRDLRRPEATPGRARGCPRKRAGGNSGDERGAGPKPSRWSAARRRPGCAGRPTLRKRGVAPYGRDRIKDTASRRYAIPSVGGSEAEKEEKEEEPGHECPGNEETGDTNFVGWVERCARTHRTRSRKGRRWVSLSLNPSYGEKRETRKNPGAAARAGTKKTALFDIVNRKTTRGDASAVAGVSRERQRTWSWPRARFDAPSYALGRLSFRRAPGQKSKEYRRSGRVPRPFPHKFPEHFGIYELYCAALLLGLALSAMRKDSQSGKRVLQ